MHAISLINNTEDLSLDELGQYGLFAVGEWINDKGDDLIQQLDQAREKSDKL